MFFWSSFPFVRLVIPFGVGIFLASHFSISNHQPLVLIALAVLISIQVLFYFFNTRFQHNALAGALISMIFLLLGVFHFSAHRQSEYQKKLELNVASSWSGEVLSVKKKQGIIQSFVVEVAQLKLKNEWEGSGFKLLVFNRDSLLETKIGDKIGATGLIAETMAPQNPAQFNYQQFLEYKNIFHTTFEDEYVIQGGGASLLRLADECRLSITNVYRDLGIEGDNFAVLVALTLGDKTFLDFDLQKKYAGAGAMHILAVSGLHVGIVFLIFSFLLSRFPDKLAFRIAKSVLLLLVIWAFAFLAGLSPSVQRAAWMFSFVILSQLFKRNSNILNSISISAFLLMMINPNSIFQVGFQLSYAAVAGIVLIYPTVYKLLYVKNWLLDKAWSLLVVSIAAQFATLPFTLAYFHQFPNYFLVANLFVIPLAFAAVVGAIVVVSFYLIFNISFLLPQILDAIIFLLNWGIEQVNLLPGAVSQGVWFEPLSIKLIVVVIVGVTAFLNFKKARLLLASLVSVSLIFMIEIGALYIHSNQKKIVFYALANPTWTEINGLTAKVFYVEGGRDYDKKMVREHLSSLHVEKVNWIPVVNKVNQIFSIGGRTILLFPSTTEIDVEVDYLIPSRYSKNLKSNNGIVMDYYYRSDLQLNDLIEGQRYFYFKKEVAYISNY